MVPLMITGTMGLVGSILAILFMACWAALFARSRGHTAAGWFILGLLFGPFAVLFSAFLTPDTEEIKRRQATWQANRDRNRLLPAFLIAIVSGLVLLSSPLAGVSPPDWMMLASCLGLAAAGALWLGRNDHKVKTGVKVEVTELAKKEETTLVQSTYWERLDKLAGRHKVTKAQ
jgi:MFS family permease